MNTDDVVDALLNGIPPLVSVGGLPLDGTDDFGTSQNAPFFVIGPPELSWEGETFCAGHPREGTFPVVVVVDQNVFTTRDSPKLAIAVARAIQQVLPQANIGIVRPVAFTGGGTGERPGYEIPVSVIFSDES